MVMVNLITISINRFLIKLARLSHISGIMKNLLDELRNAGLSDNEARKSIEVVYEWVEEKYPVLAAVARSTVAREISSPDRSVVNGRES